MDSYFIYIFIPLSLFTIFPTARCNSTQSDCACPRTCTCIREEDHGLSATCTTRDSDLVLLADEFDHPTQVKSLDLSGNNLSNLPFGVFGNFSHLQNLSLAQNRIHSLTYDIFEGLQQLQILNLSMNNLRTWKGGSTGHLLSLKIIDMRGNDHWALDEQTLQLRSLELIAGVTWSKQCQKCNLEKTGRNDLVVKELAKGNNSIEKIRCGKLTNAVSKFYQMMASYGFIVVGCRQQERCENSEVRIVEYIMASDCWLISKRLMILHGTLGAVSILLNLVVVLTFLTSRSLWKNVSMTLASNMAFSDLLMGIYGILIASVVLHYGNTTFHFRDQICPKIGIFWMLGQSVTIQSSVLLTADRFITIENSLKPQFRITFKIVKIALVLCWTVALFVSVYPLFKGFYSLTPSCVPLTVRQGVAVKRYTLGVSITAFCLYLFTLPMYARIYRVVSHSSRQMGIQREVVVLKKISLLVGTNFMFFFLPTACLGLITLLMSEVKEGRAAVIQNLHFWLPSLSVGLNSCINPILYSYRNGKFHLALRERFRFAVGKGTKVRPPHVNFRVRPHNTYSQRITVMTPHIMSPHTAPRPFNNTAPSFFGESVIL